MKRFTINEQGVGTYVLDEKNTFTLDMGAVFGYAKLPPLAQNAVSFAVGHVLRNATAGKVKDKLAEAVEGIKDRIKALEAGKWSAHRETGEAGESKMSLLSQALARVLQIEPQEAAEMVSKEVTSALEEAGIDPETEADDLTDDEKKKKRKIAAQVRKGIADDPAVADAMLDVKAERLAAEKAANAAETAKGERKSRFV